MKAILADVLNRRTLLIILLTAILCFLGTFLPTFKGFSDLLRDYLGRTIPPLILGIFIGSLIDYFVPRDIIIRYLSGKKIGVILRSILLGFTTSVCSHGILAIGMELKKKGASTAAVVSFLLAAPWASLPVTFLLFSFFGWKALLFILVAILTSLTTGIIYQILEEKGIVEKGNPRIHLHTHKREGGEILQCICRSSIDLTNMILFWVLLGVILAAFFGSFIPKGFFMRYLGPTFGGMLLTLLFASLMEICSEGTAPLAFEIYRKTGAFGNSLVFLMAGVATDYTEIGVIWQNIGKRAAILLPLVSVPQILFWGYLFNLLL